MKIVETGWRDICLKVAGEREFGMVESEWAMTIALPGSLRPVSVCVRNVKPLDALHDPATWTRVSQEVHMRSHTAGGKATSGKPTRQEKRTKAIVGDAGWEVKTVGCWFRRRRRRDGDEVVQRK